MFAWKTYGKRPFRGLRALFMAVLVVFGFLAVPTGRGWDGPLLASSSFSLIRNVLNAVHVYVYIRVLHLIHCG